MFCSKNLPHLSNTLAYWKKQKVMQSMILSVRRYGNYTTIYNKKDEEKKKFGIIFFFHFLHQTYCKNGTKTKYSTHLINYAIIYFIEDRSPTRRVKNIWLIHLDHSSWVFYQINTQLEFSQVEYFKKYSNSIK